MDPALLTGLLLAAVLLAALVWLTVERARLTRRVREAQASLSDLQQRVDGLSGEATSARLRAAAAPVVPQQEYVITDVGRHRAGASAEPVRTRAVLSAALGESLVKAAALGYGVRRALSAESRNRITFEMRREIKRARKQRRRRDRQAIREARRQEPAA